MFEKNKTAWNKERIKQLTDVRNIALYLFALIVLAITWSGIKTVQSNYELQKEISELEQQNAVLQLENENSALQNKYLETDQYLELAARRDLGLAAPGETVMIVPKDVALGYVDSSIVSNIDSSEDEQEEKTGYRKNLDDWRNFLLGRKVSTD